MDIVRRLRDDHWRQVAPDTTGAVCCDCTGGDEGGDSCVDPEELPDVEDPDAEFAAGDVVGDVVFDVVVEWPGSALLK